MDVIRQCRISIWRDYLGNQLGIGIDTCKYFPFRLRMLTALDDESNACFPHANVTVLQNLVCDL